MGIRLRDLSTIQDLASKRQGLMVQRKTLADGAVKLQVLADGKVLDNVVSTPVVDAIMAELTGMLSEVERQLESLGIDVEEKED